MLCHGTTDIKVFFNSSPRRKLYSGGRTAAHNPAHAQPPAMQLEEEVGAQLFNRLSRKITLTRGRAYLRRRAEEIVGLVQKTEKEISACDEMVEGEISIGAGELYAVQYLPPLIKSFREIYPMLPLKFTPAMPTRLKSVLKTG